MKGAAEGRGRRSCGGGAGAGGRAGARARRGEAEGQCRARGRHGLGGAPPALPGRAGVCPWCGVSGAAGRRSGDRPQPSPPPRSFPPVPPGRRRHPGRGWPPAGVLPRPVSGLGSRAAIGEGRGGGGGEAAVLTGRRSLVSPGEGSWGCGLRARQRSGSRPSPRSRGQPARCLAAEFPLRCWAPVPARGEGLGRKISGLLRNTFVLTRLFCMFCFSFPAALTWVSAGRDAKGGSNSYNC